MKTVLKIALITIGVLVVLYALGVYMSTGREKARRYSCERNLKHMGMVSRTRFLITTGGQCIYNSQPQLADYLTSHKTAFAFESVCSCLVLLTCPAGLLAHAAVLRKEPI